ncbi:hypothetical protein [Ktedonospora formicarum]|uniref:Bacterial spore germination immunoglobulin-like domain-containing protein n=1 Tax=Ktedonospora formicarum TaxID=2778364 RepID=A0A8J3HX19_9CHLR|nr:hypothetical protein [Ktedonospora formicarum]GHO43576.1 hypothetical protein KSX_17390 [Ktedonospora formicarum]
MSRYTRDARGEHALIGPAIFFLLLLILSGCGNIASTDESSQHTQTSASTPTVPLGAQACPATVSAKNYWGSVVGIQREQNSIAGVTCAHLKGDKTLQALVVVQYSGASGGVKDVYVYDQITSPAPTTILELKDLYQGEALISGYNTVITREIDWDSSMNKGKDKDAVQPDLYREFKWAAGAGGMFPVAFRGLYPDMTRYQAEDDQKQVEMGQNKWKLNALQVAQHMGNSLLQWPMTSKASIVSQNGAEAVIHLTGPHGNMLTVTLGRLEGRANGIWLVTNVTSAHLTITQPVALDHLTRNFTLQGKGTISKGSTEQIKVLDHLYQAIGNASTQSQSGTSTFSAKVSYTPTFTRGSEDGIVGLFARDSNNTIIDAVLFKTLLD